MLLGLFRNNRSGGISILAILLLITGLKSFFEFSPDSDLPGQMPLFELFWKVTQSAPISNALFTVLLFISIVIILFRLNTIYFLLNDRSFLPGIMYILICISIPAGFNPGPELVATPFLLLSLLLVFKGAEHRADPMALFNGTLTLLLGSLFYLKIIWFVPFLWIAAGNLRPLKWRGILNPLAAVLAMYLIYLSVYWVIKDDFKELTILFSSNLKISGSLREFTKLEWIIIFYLLFITLLSSGHLVNRFQAKKIIIRKIYQALFFLFIYTFLFFLFVSRLQIAVIFIGAIPLSYLFSQFLQQKKVNWMHELMIWIWIVLIAGVHYDPAII